MSAAGGGGPEQQGGPWPRVVCGPCTEEGQASCRAQGQVRAHEDGAHQPLPGCQPLREEP